MAGQRALDEGALPFIEAHLLEPHGAATSACAQAEVSGTHKLALREQDSTLDSVIELAHISRPGMIKEKLRRAGVESGNAFAIALRIATEEVMRQKRNILAALAQRRK